MIVTIGLVILSGAASKIALKFYRRAKQAEAKLARIAATDNEILCVLEATDTPLAKKLLAAASEPKSLPKPISSETISKKFWADFNAYALDDDKLAVLRRYKKYGITFEADAYARVISLLVTAYARKKASEILGID